jgi:hypothetical protein
MNEFNKIILEQLPLRLEKFLDTLTGNEINELKKVNAQLIAKIYQAGSVFSIEILEELKKEL